MPRTLLVLLLSLALARQTKYHVEAYGTKPRAPPSPGTLTARIAVPLPRPHQHRGCARVQPSPRSAVALGSATSEDQEPAVGAPRDDEYLGGDDAKTTASPVAVTNADDFSPRPFLERPYLLAISGLVGALTGLNVALFKLSTEYVRDFFYGDGLFDRLPPVSGTVPLPLIPALGGLSVGVIILLGRGQSFPPGLRGVVSEADADAAQASGWRVADECGGGVSSERSAPGPGRVVSDLARYGRKSAAAVVTLGSGNSLGPEGPAVEAGMSVSRLCWELAPPAPSTGDAERDVAAAAERSRLLLACGAAAGVSAGFNAPLSGVFFVLEILQQALNPVNVERWNVDGKEETQGSIVGPVGVGANPVASESVNISAILLASVISSLVSKLFLEDELALKATLVDLRSPLQEFPLFLVLGALSGLVAALFSGAAQASKSVFDGCSGPQPVKEAFSTIPSWFKPTIGALFCGGVALVYPQVLFFGYETLNTAILASTTCKTETLLQLLAAKFATTAVATSSGLIGGTFAPSLFLGGTLGASFHQVVQSVMQSTQGTTTAASLATLGDVATPAFSIIQLQPFELSNMPTYAVVGAASVLSALFRAPLTATLLLFECTRDYDVILPLMASASMGSLTGDIIESALKERRRELDSVSWGDLAMRNGEEESCEVEYEEEKRSEISALFREKRR